MPSAAEISICDNPRFEPITVSTENCAGLMSMLASVRMKSWKIQIWTRRTK